NKITAAIDGESGREYFLVVGGRSPVRLAENPAGRYTGTLDAEGAGDFRIMLTRPFSEALRDFYTTDNFRSILASEDFHFGKYFWNSLVVATSASLLTVLICTLAGYAFAQRQFHFRDQLFVILLGSMLVPGMIFMVPQFSITLKFGMMDSYAGMVVPHLANVFGLFLLRQYVSQIPRDLFNAAEIDGAREYQVFQNIVIPICLPIMVTLFLLVFVTQWSNFLWQLIINTGRSPYITLPVGLQQFKGQNANEWEKIMAGACFSIVPIAALFLSLQRYFLEGLTAGAVKE
ncbi:carbohydrate ABC transporter permease, partial [Candidatus Poribacteria bacterium]|nr:carbohydrate ABC transporter permease [Candidatus Poribacteria bacterium]